MRVFVTTKQVMGWVPEQPVEIVDAHNDFSDVVEWLPVLLFPTLEDIDRDAPGMANVVGVAKGTLKDEAVQFIIHEVELNPVV